MRLQKMRLRSLIILGASTWLVWCLFTLIPGSAVPKPYLTHLDQTSPRSPAQDPTSPEHEGPPKPESPEPTGQPEQADLGPPKQEEPPKPEEPEAHTSAAPVLPPIDTHPMWHLITEAEKDVNSTVQRQSATLEQAVAEYRRRYKIPPPPHFDKWFEFAQNRSVRLIDEFDSIHEFLTPFWGLKPKTIRARAAEALGFDNFLMGVQIRSGQVTHVGGAREWQQDSTRGMIEPFVQWLPDMDLAFNIHDEPRVIVPHDDMSRLVHIATTVTMPAAQAAANPHNNFTALVEGLNDGTRFEETKATRFNVFAHQPTWTHSRMSCPPDSPARALEEEDRRDNEASWALGELGFVYNESALADICRNPSFSSTYGFFDRPNAFDIVLDLFPIFSQSKISSYADILYPSPWYWSDQVPYHGADDMEWDAKQTRLFWRGSTTGGFSRNGGWRRQHRQRFVRKINAVENAPILTSREGEGDDDSSTRLTWHPTVVPRGDFRGLMDVYFSHIGQCDPGDCNAQREFFTVQGYAEQNEAWRYKFLLDMDGNAFSGRFYAFLLSRSLVYKFALFREWHRDWLRPWAHYIPMSLRGDEWLEAVRFFAHPDGPGWPEAERLARTKREWAQQVLRKEDLEVWFFRLLLEYGRVVDDNREQIGFSL